LYTIFKDTFPGKVNKEPRKLGIMLGLIEYMVPDFNEPLEDFDACVPE